MNIILIGRYTERKWVRGFRLPKCFIKFKKNSFKKNLKSFKNVLQIIIISSYKTQPALPGLKQSFSASLKKMYYKIMCSSNSQSE